MAAGGARGRRCGRQFRLVQSRLGEGLGHGLGERWGQGLHRRVAIDRGRCSRTAILLKNWRIHAGRNDDLQRLTGTVGGIIFAQFLTQTMDLHPGYGVFGGVEIGRTAQYFSGDTILANLGVPTLEVLFADVLEKLHQPLGAGKGG